MNTAYKFNGKTLEVESINNGETATHCIHWDGGLIVTFTTCNHSCRLIHDENGLNVDEWFIEFAGTDNQEEQARELEQLAEAIETEYGDLFQIYKIQ